LYNRKMSIASKVTSIASPSKIWRSKLTLRICFLTLTSQEAWPTRIHRATGDALDDSIGNIEEENIKLNERIKELEETLMPLPFLSIPLEIVGPTMLKEKIKGSSSLLTPAKIYMDNNIKKIMALIMEAWEVSKRIISFGSRMHGFLEHLQDNLKNEEGFYLDVVEPFGIKVSNMLELKIREEDIPSTSRIK